MFVDSMNRALVTAAFVALAAGCDKGSADGPPGGGKGNAAQAPPAPVEVAVAREDTVVDAIAATGQIEAVQSVELRPDIEGRIVDILFRDGAEVAKGTPLFKIDDAELRAQVARLEAERDLSEQALARTRQLVEQKASSTADLERAEATARSNRAQLDLLKVRLERTVVRAPFSGVVGQRRVSVGDYVTTSTPLVLLQTVNPQRAVFQVPERHADRLKVGQRVVFRVAALPSEDFIGVVDFVDPVVQLPGRTITVRAVTPNGNRRLQAGMFIEARLATDVRPRAVLVPEDAVLPLQGATFVWVVTGNKVTRRQVALGVRIPGFVEVTSGVDAGEQVVVGGVERLMDGQTVAPKVVDRTPKRAPIEGQP
ncbi:MAG: efflux RND transporter periplasmic adaptor subunit [Gemmatimonadota bacterium]